MRLTELANRFGTDKGTTPAQGHGYTIIYDMLFAPLRDSIGSICEVGLSRGGPEVVGGSSERNVLNVPSVRMWREFFPKADITGVDISDCSAFANEWFSFVQADCGDDEQLKRVAATGKTFDIVVDDGSHAAYHQQLTFMHLYPLVKPGGLYIIEDLNWQPETYAASLPPVPRTDELIEQFLRSGRFANTGAIEAARWNAMAADIENIVTFDEDWLAMHRRQANAVAGVEPEYLKRIDYRDRGATRWKSAAAAVARTAKREFSGNGAFPNYPKMQLAIIRKRH